MIDFGKLVFLPLDISTPPDISAYLDTIDKDHEAFVQDNYRVSPSIILMTPNGQWMDHTKNIPNFVAWAETELFKTFPRSQMVVITTPASNAMAPHIDCSPERFNTIQHKLRYVFRGNVSDLRWYNGDQLVATPSTDKLYVISGKWPHDMVNTHHNTKYTLCLGAPWEASLEDQHYVELLKRSYDKYGDIMLSYDNWSLPDNWKHLFNQERYGIPHDLEFKPN